jgi:hypothetical protein
VTLFFDAPLGIQLPLHVGEVVNPLILNHRGGELIDRVLNIYTYKIIHNFNTPLLPVTPD